MAATDTDRQMAEALSKTLRSHRKRVGKTQEELAGVAGIDSKYYQSMESGRGNSSADSVANPSLQVLRKLAEAYGVSVPDLMWDVFNDGADDR
ncbi:MAG: helix-turn-helix transcriptional regulator [Aeromicrobium sp.]